MRLVRRRACGALCVLLLAGIGACAGVALPPVPLPAFELPAVPFYPQTTHQCGPAALATVLGSSGIAVTPAALVREVYLPARHGSLQVELLAAMRRHGRIAYLIDPTLAGLLAEVAAGHPVLVLQNLGIALIPRWHYAVVVGYDRAADALTLRSGDEARRRVRARLFDRTWRRSHRFGVIALAPGELPAALVPERYFAAAAALEALGQLDAPPVPM